MPRLRKYPEPNVSLLHSTFEKIRADRKHWDQSVWGRLKGKFTKDIKPEEFPCKTTLCFAGHVVIDAGYKPVWRFESLGMSDKGRWVFTDVIPPGKTWRSQVGVSSAARELLGLSKDEATELFGGENTIPALRRVIKGIEDGSIRKAQQEFEKAERGYRY